jgi:hypothetical protein
MAAKKAPKYSSLFYAQERANNFVQAHISTKPLGLPEGLSEEDFTKTMDAIVKAMMWAWSDGFMAAREEG